jgi:ring-1,2-phenylacetyl-CoA epoxidase subunit PaaE
MGLTIASLARNFFSPSAAGPLLRKPSARWARPSTRSSFLELRVAEVIAETPTTKTFVFDDSSLRYAAGQHLTVVVEIDGRTERRCYSFSSSPASGSRPAITVRRVDDGKVSGYLHDHLHAGDVLRAASPTGSFTVATDPSASRVIAMVAGGVGITPIISMAETILREEPGSRVVLVYGNRSEKEIVFRRRLEALVRDFDGRLRVTLALDAAGTRFKGLVGPLSGERVLEALAGENADLWFVCGPQPMMDSVVATLEGRGVASDRIPLERFLTADTPATALPTEPATLRFATSGATAVAPIGVTILDAAEKAGIALPSSCRMGGCGACWVKVKGRVVAAEPNCLTEAERAEGYALACCSYGDGEVTLPDF